MVSFCQVFSGLAHSGTTQSPSVSLGHSVHDASESLVHHQGLHLDGAIPGGLLNGDVLSDLGCNWLAWGGARGPRFSSPSKTRLPIPAWALQKQAG